jgi:hypothetical protein
LLAFARRREGERAGGASTANLTPNEEKKAATRHTEGRRGAEEEKKLKKLPFFSFF